MIPLHVRSHYSLLRGGSSIEALVARAKALRLPALALTDTGGLCGAAIFFETAKRAGITPLLGADVDGMTLLTRNRNGWANLCSILSRRHLGQPLEIGRFQEDLHFIVEDVAKARALRGIADRLWVEVVRPKRSESKEREAIDSGLPLVASSDAHVAAPEDHATHRVLSAIRTNTTLAQLGPTCDPGHHLRDLRPLFADLPQALKNNEAIAADGAWNLLPSPVLFPRYDVPAGETPAGLLRSLCGAGMIRRYGTPPEAARERLDRELAVISRLGFCEYFLVVHDIVGAARAKNAPVAGRGSGASSLVSYVLGLTNVCPLRYGLQFERFLHDGRTDWPDLDLDFCWRTRDEVIGYAFERFGRGRVAMVSSHLTFQARGAFREAARVHGLSDDQIQALRRALPADTLDAPLRDVRRLPIEPHRVAAILADARRILGAPQHLSVHPGGVVIARGPIDRVTPVQRAEKGVVISQFDKDGVEAIGLVKIDLLGNRAVSTIRATTDLIERLDGYRLDAEAIPDGDPETQRLLGEGRTIGVNQLESPAMRHLLRMMRARGVDDVMKALALIRPGAAGGGMKETFVKRHRGLEPWSVDPRLRHILGPGCGVMLYEDDAMLVLSALTGATLAEGDAFRRRLQKSTSPGERLALGREFGRRCVAAGTPVGVARDLWRQMAKFTGYCFCMSHAASYAQLAYAAAWLRAHHPLAFWIAALNNNQGMYEKRVYVAEARRTGVRTRGPDVNRSAVEFSEEGDAIRTGFDSILGLGQRSIATILEQRPFESLFDFVCRAQGVSFPDARALVDCGAFDFLDRPRPEMLMELHATWRRRKPVRVPRVPDYDPREKARRTFERTGLCPDMHLLELLWPLESRRRPEHRLSDSRSIPSRIGRPIRLAGALDAVRVTDTRHGDAMEFLTLEDEYGLFEVTVFPSLYRRHAGGTATPGPYVVDGTVEDAWGATTINATRIGCYETRAGTTTTILPAH